MALVAYDEPPAPQLGERYGDLVESLTDLARTLTETESVRDTLQSILALALRSIPGCHAASITVLDDKEQPSTVAATDEETYELDRRQYVLHDGPCMDAARRQQVSRWNLHEAEQRWPEFTDRKSTRLNSSHSQISYAVFCLKKKKLTYLR